MSHSSLCSLLVSVCSSCLYYYEVQPPDSIDCNPEGSEDLAVNCTACAVKPNNFTLGWVKQNEDLMTLLENSDKRMITNISTDSSNSKGQQVQCVSSQLILVGNSTQHYGHYFCQIQDDNEGTYNHSTVLPLFPHSTCPNGNTFQSASYLCAVPLQMDGMVVPSSSITITTIVTVVTTTIVVVVSTVEAVQTPPALSSYCAGCCSMEPMASIMTDESNSAAVSAVATTLSTFFVVLIVLVLIVIGWLAVKAYLYRRSEMCFTLCMLFMMLGEVPVTSSCALYSGPKANPLMVVG